MSYVKTQDFVKTLEELGLVFPKNVVSATIKLQPGQMVRIDCEMYFEYIDVTAIHDNVRRVAPAATRIETKKFKLVEDTGE